MRFPRFSLSLFVLFIAAAGASAQAVGFEYLYKFEPTMMTSRPQLGGLEVEFPAAARKNGVEGRVIAAVTLGEDGRTRDISILQDLPHGVGAAVVDGLKKWYFKPAAFEGKPVAVKATVDYIVTMVYGEGDSAVSKPVITTKPVTAAYPPKYLADKVKGKVAVVVLFRADGTKKVVSVTSTMPREFDRAAVEAVAALQFKPALHKKSKKPVSAEMTVEYDFKP